MKMPAPISTVAMPSCATFSSVCSIDRSLCSLGRRSGTRDEAERQGVCASAQFSPDGKRILTASYDNTARLWPLLPTNVKPAEWLGDFLVYLHRRTANW